MSVGGGENPMSWRNQVVPVGSLPAVDAAPFERLEPRYLTQQRVIWGILIGLLLVGGIVAMVLTGPPIWVWALAVAGALVLFGIAWILEGLAYDYRGVQLREHDVSARRGLIGRSTISVPFTRVQHVTLERGAFDRLFGLAQVVIFTAGAIAADARVKGLTPERAERLREGIINRSNLAATDDE
jgi:membrane protein YdbS with pleckstrin-like domain